MSGGWAGFNPRDVPQRESTACPDCDGTGTWLVMTPRRSYRADGLPGPQRIEACPYCGGTGQVCR